VQYDEKTQRVIEYQGMGKGLFGENGKNKHEYEEFDTF